VECYFDDIGHSIPTNTNPAEFLLDIVSADFNSSKEMAQERVQVIQTAWIESAASEAVNGKVLDRARLAAKEGDNALIDDLARPGALPITSALLHRLFIKSYRDVVAYGIRIVMYLGMDNCAISRRTWLI
jgi:hypothetical protein